MEDLGAGAERIAERRRAERHHHEFLEVDAAVRVRAAVQDVHHRRRQDRAGGAVVLLVQPREVRVERHAGRGGAGARQRHRHAEQRVGPQPPLRGRPVERDHRAVDRALVGVLALERRGELAVHVPDRLRHALAEIALLVAVAQLQRLAHAGRGARRHRRAAHHPALERHVHFHRRIPARIQDLSAVYRRDLRQISRSPSCQIPRLPDYCEPR